MTDQTDQIDDEIGDEVDDDEGLTEAEAEAIGDLKERVGEHLENWALEHGTKPTPESVKELMAFLKSAALSWAEDQIRG